MMFLGHLFEEGFSDAVEIAGLAAVFRKAILEEQVHMLIYMLLDNRRFTP